MTAKTPYWIAEVGFNHEGHVETGKQMIQAAAEAGAQAVKFQTYRASDIALPSSPHFQLIVQGEMNLEQHQELAQEARRVNIEFLSTPFSLWAVELLETVGVGAYKVASMDCTNHYLLNAIAETGKPVYLSTGMATLAEIGETIEFLKNHNSGPVTILHCISKYPAEAKDLNLECIPFLRSMFGLPLGYSDHYPGPKACLAAAMMGAEVIETHFTLDNTQEGGDHYHSVSPEQLNELIQEVRLFAEMRGDHENLYDRPDRKLIEIFRRGVYAASDLQAGHVLGEQDILTSRPASELSPNDLSRILGRPLKQNVEQYASIGPDSL